MTKIQREDLTILSGFAAVAIAVLTLVGCSESAATYRSNADRDQRIKEAELDNWRTEERLQKQIDELRQRVERLEKSQ